MRTVPQTPAFTESQQHLLRTVFDLVLETGRPVPVAALAAAAGMDRERVADELAGLDADGRIRRTPEGDVTGAFGLTAEDTRHEVVIGGARRHTWCAVDALGILGALDATGEVHTASPRTGRPLRLEFCDGEPTGGDLDCVVLLASYQPGTKVVESWCPLVNFFADAEDALAWAAEQGVDGECVPLAEAADRARRHWRQRLRSPGDPA